MKNIPFQHELRPALPEIPNIYGALDYRDFREVLIKIDHLLVRGGLEEKLVNQALSLWSSDEFEILRSWVFKMRNFRAGSILDKISFRQNQLT